MKTYMSRSQTRFWSGEMPIGDPFGGPAYGEKTEPFSAITAWATANSGVLALAGLAMNVVGTLSQASSQQANYQYESQASTYNAQVAENNALAAESQGAAEMDRQRRLAKKTQGKAEAGFSASGIVSSEGSPLDLLAESAAMAELDYQTIKYNTDLKATQYRQTAALDRASAYNKYQRGEDAMSAGYLQAAGQAFGGGARAYGMGGGSSPGSGLNSQNSFDNGSMMSAMRRTG